VRRWSTPSLHRPPKYTRRIQVTANYAYTPASHVYDIISAIKPTGVIRRISWPEGPSVHSGKLITLWSYTAAPAVLITAADADTSPGVESSVCFIGGQRNIPILEIPSVLSPVSMQCMQSAILLWEICLSVCPTLAGIVTIRMDISSYLFDALVETSSF